MDKQNKVIVSAIVGLVLILSLVFITINKLKTPSVKVPDNYGEVEVDEDGEEILGLLEEGLLESDGSANPNLATFDAKKAKSMKANKKVDVLYADKELDETVIKKKPLYFISSTDNTPSDNLNYAVNYIFQEMTGGGNQDLFIWITQEGDVFVDLDSSVYTGLMTEYFPLKNFDPSCTDFSVDEESASKSIHLLLQNTELIAEQLMKQDKKGPELQDIYFIYGGNPTEIEGVTDKSGKML